MITRIRLQADLFTSPVAYGWRRDEGYLYIGSTSRLAIRLATHHVIGRVEKLLKTDSIDVWLCDDLVEAHNKERNLIERHQPKYNKTGYERPEKFPKPSRTIVDLPSGEVEILGMLWDPITGKTRSKPKL